MIILAKVIALCVFVSIIAIFFFCFVASIRIMRFKKTFQSIFGIDEYKKLVNADRWNGELFWLQIPRGKVPLTDDQKLRLTNSSKYKDYLFNLKWYKRGVGYILVAMALLNILIPYTK